MAMRTPKVDEKVPKKMGRTPKRVTADATGLEMKDVAKREKALPAERKMTQAAPTDEQKVTVEMALGKKPRKSKLAGTLPGEETIEPVTGRKLVQSNILSFLGKKKVQEDDKKRRTTR